MKSMHRILAASILAFVLALVPVRIVPAEEVPAEASPDAIAAVASESTPSWTFDGVTVSAPSVVSGQGVTVAPVVSGDLEGATYNYVWSRDGSWKKGEWSSTALDTGSYTAEPSWEFRQSVPGTYTIYVDVLSQDGEKRTMSTTVTVTAPEWSLDGVDVSASTVVSGEDVTIAPILSGDLDGATYNYVWVRDGSWKAGEWSSTALDTGSYTSEATGAFSQRRAGTYTIYVDVMDRTGVKRTMSTTVTVTSPDYEFSGVDASESTAVTDTPVTIAPILSGDLEGATYNYVWVRDGSWKAGEWSSTALETGSYTSDPSWTFRQRRAGTYTVYVDVMDRAGVKRTMSTTVTVTSPDYEFSGVATTAGGTVMPGDPITITPLLSGDLDGATYNYVWVRDGSWKAGEWSSTALETGSYTSDRSWAFSTVRAGTYTIYVDVLDRAGVKRTMSTTVVVRDDTWAVDGIDASCDSPVVVLGDQVTISPRLLGDTEGMTFNYVWCHNGSWKKGEWGSTALDSGSYTTDSSATFTLDKSGTYILYVDCLSRRGEKRTVEVHLTVCAGLDYCWLKDSVYWAGGSAVKVKIIDKHYSSGRFGEQITKIVIHHNAGNLTTEGCYDVWQTRQASAHYQVEANGTVGQIVYDSDTAWHAGNWTVNTQSIGIEHADYRDANGQWRMTDATIDSGARLVAALCLQYNLGRPEWGVNLVGHNECCATACPASLAVGGSQHNVYVSRAQEWYDKLSKL